MKRIATRKEMQAIDAYSIHEIGIPGTVLMERASMALLEEVMKRFDHHSRCLIVVEKGNNGGDGLALGRLLAEKDYLVDIYEIGGIAKASDSYLAQRQILEKLDIPIRDHWTGEEYDLIIDGIFGVGLTREVTGIHREAIERLNASSAYRIAIDVPSGVDASTGRVLGIAFRADLTVTFGLQKIGLLLYPGAGYAGEVVVRDIGFPMLAVDEVDPGAFTYEPGDEERIPGRRGDSHKGSYGKVLVVAGSKNMAGAAYLSAKAAYRCGCGLVRIFTKEENRVILQTLLPEAILTTYEGLHDGVPALSEAMEWADVILFGPGQGRGEITEWFLHLLRENAKVPVVIDADGLNEISGMENRGADFLAGFSVPVILTPHMQEMSRLSGETVAELKENRISLAEQYAGENQIVLVLKDSRTIVTEGGKRLYINSNGNSGMATGGSGDVLSGVIAGMLSAGMKPFEAASMAVYLHGHAGDTAARVLGERAMLAGDLPDYIF